MIHLVGSTVNAVIGVFPKPPETLRPTLSFSNQTNNAAVVTLDLFQNKELVHSIPFKFPPFSESEMQPVGINYCGKVDMRIELVIEGRVSHSGVTLTHYNDVDQWEVPDCVSQKIIGTPSGFEETQR